MPGEVDDGLTGSAGLTWLEDGELAFVEIPADGQITIGRAADRTVKLDDLRVSRQHARITGSGGAYEIEHLSRTNPTWVNEQILDTSGSLPDGAIVRVGATRLTFHNLASADQTQLVVECGYCHRTNEAAGKECWYCGTSLVYASTAMAQRRIAVCRLVSASGDVHDLFAGDVASVYPDRPPEVRPAEEAPGEGPAILTPESRPKVRTGAATEQPTVNGRPVEGEHGLQTGDRLGLGSYHFVVLVRAT